MSFFTSLFLVILRLVAPFSRSHQTYPKVLFGVCAKTEVLYAAIDISWNLGSEIDPIAMWLLAAFDSTVHITTISLPLEYQQQAHEEAL